MKDVFHGPLKCGIKIFKVEGNDLIIKYTPWGSEGSLVSVLGVYSDYFVAMETIH